MANPTATGTKPKTEPRTLVAFLARLVQIAFCIVCVAVAANWSKIWWQYRSKSWQVYIMLESVNLAIFAGVTGAFVAAFFLLARRVTPVVANDLPGLIDMVVSSIYSVLFLSAGASLLSWGSCKQDALCLSWNGTVGVCFFLFVAWLITAVCAALDLRAQIQALKGVPPGAQTAANGVKSSGSGSKPGTPTKASMVKPAADVVAKPATDVVAKPVGPEAV